jgi:glycosyltransferase involved in cell wall biosynthesis
MNTISVDVLMAVHPSDDANHFALSLDSMIPFINDINATILVADGALTASHREIVFKRIETLKIKLVEIPVSGGLGNALNVGAKVATSEFLLRMDADDICRGNRLSRLKQELIFRPEIDVMSSYIAEFEHSAKDTVFVRKVPLKHDDILRSMRWQSPMNHMACIIRRSAVLAVGGYEGGRGFPEDWWMWVKMACAGYHFANIPEILIDARIGNGFITRRRGWKMFRQDVKLICKMRDCEFITIYGGILLLLLKLTQRFIPILMLTFAYRYIRSKPSSHVA